MHYEDCKDCVPSRQPQTAESTITVIKGDITKGKVGLLEGNKLHHVIVYEQRKY